MIHTCAGRVTTALLRELREKSGMKQEEFVASIISLQQIASAVKKSERMLLALEQWIYLGPLGVTPLHFVDVLYEGLAKENTKPSKR